MLLFYFLLDIFVLQKVPKIRTLLLWSALKDKNGQGVATQIEQNNSTTFAKCLNYPNPS